MAREFEIPIVDANLEDAQFRLENERDEEGKVIPHRKWLTGIDRRGSAARMAIKGRMPLVVHGSEAPDNATPLTLAVFEWNTERLCLGHRFREVTLEVVFTAAGSRRDADHEAKRLLGKGVGLPYWDPEVLAVAPEHTAWYHRTNRAVTEKAGADLDFKFTAGDFFSAGPRVYWERTEAVNRTDAIQLSGDPAIVGPGHTRPNAVRWVMLENESQRSGVPAFLRTAILLRRRPGDNGQFVARVNVSFKVSPVHDFKEALFNAVGLLPVDDPIVFDPEVETTVPPHVDRARLGEFNVAGEFQLVSLEPLPAATAEAPGKAEQGGQDAAAGKAN